MSRLTGGRPKTSGSYYRAARDRDHLQGCRLNRVLYRDALLE